MNATVRQQLESLRDHLAARREVILQSWRRAVDADPEQTTARALTRGQFNDHIPQVLDAFERKLGSRAGGAEAHAASVEQKQEEVKHGLHRWQQGYRLRELMHEWSHLQVCLFEEVVAFAAIHPELERDALVEVHRRMIALVNESISESAAQYERMQQAEAVGHVTALKHALDSVHEVELRRAALIRQAVHDVRGSVFGVSVAAHLLGEDDVTLAQRAEFTVLVDQGIKAVTAMLGELMELARLEAGQEHRVVATFDAATLATELCGLHRPFARERGLFLKMEGPDRLEVDGDAARVRRLLQNLLLNALKYTERGGVLVSWGEEKESWWVMIKDTGPGLVDGPRVPMVGGLEEATTSARESDEKSAESKGETSQVLTPPAGAGSTPRPSPHNPSEGIGLSIVKRLCELLDASLELVSAPDEGTTFRVVLPRTYPGGAGAARGPSGPESARDGS